MQRVIVTGGAGFIGSELVRQLAGQGFAVRVIDNLASGRRENLKEVLGTNVEVVVADVRDRELVASLIQNAHTVFHLACVGLQRSIQSPAESHAVNAVATLGLLEAARRHGVKRFVYVSSSEVYGMPLRTPITEDHPTQPVTIYGASKLAGESYTRAFWHTYRYPTTVVRAFDCYGPLCQHEDESRRTVSELMLCCLADRPMRIRGEGSETRDFTFVSDMARGILDAGVAEAGIGQTLNLGTSRETSFRELAKLTAEALGRSGVQVPSAEVRAGDVTRMVADISKANRLLGFKPSIDLRDGIARMRDWFGQQGQTAEELLQNATSARNREGLPTHAA